MIQMNETVAVLADTLIKTIESSSPDRDTMLMLARTIKDYAEKGGNKP